MSSLAQQQIELGLALIKLREVVELEVQTLAVKVRLLWMTLRGVHTRAAIGAVGLRGHADDWWQNWQPPEPRMCPHSWNPTFQEHGEPND